MSDEVREFALRCPHCGEENPPEFPVCWSCHGDLPDAAPAEPGASAPRVPRADPSLLAGRRKLVALEVGMVLVLVWLRWLAGGIWNAADPYPPRSVAFELWSLVEGAGILALLFYLLWRDGDWQRRLGLTRAHVGKELVWGGFVWGAMQLSFVVALAITLRLRVEPLSAPPHPFEPSALWIAPLSFLLWAGVEEAFYRAYLFQRLTELGAHPALAIAVSALLFATAHVYPFPGNLSLLIGGLVLGWIFWKRRSLWSLVLGHWLYNLCVTYA